jgi:hypothetical protein
MTKFSPNEMDSQTGISYIRQFINPEYDDKMYASAKKATTEVADMNSNVGKAIFNTNTAVNHLQLLQQAAAQLAKTTGDSRLPLLNSLAVKFGVETGNSAPTVFKAIANKVNQEVERASAGGATPFKDEIAGGKDILSSSNPEKVTNDIVNSYMGLMAGRMSAADENLYRTAQKHLWNIEPSTTAAFQQHGYDTPWQVKTGATSSGNPPPQQWALPKGAPPPPAGAKDGIPLNFNGKVVAVVKNGIWAAPPTQ